MTIAEAFKLTSEELALLFTDVASTTQTSSSSSSFCGEGGVKASPAPEGANKNTFEGPDCEWYVEKVLDHRVIARKKSSKKRLEFRVQWKG